MGVVAFIAPKRTDESGGGGGDVVLRKASAQVLQRSGSREPVSGKPLPVHYRSKKINTNKKKLIPNL